MTWFNMVRMLLVIMMIPWTATGQTATPIRFSVVISELYPDPDSKAGIPAFEFIELTNTSKQVINLKGWRLSDGTASGVFSGFELKPDSILVICTAGAAINFRSWGAVLTITGFPSLNNDEDIITLYDQSGTIVHSVAYNTDWYQNDIKKDGGWTLEMIDPQNPCGGIANFKASEDPAGGTPGRRNSVNAPNRDEQAPAIMKTYIKDSLNIVAVFDESLDSLSASAPGYWHLDDPALSVVRALPLARGFSEVMLTLDKPLAAERVYILTAKEVTDCSGNKIGALNNVKTGLPSAPSVNDLVINELLFNPEAAGYDYVELYNRSTRILDLQQVIIAGKNSTGSLVSALAASRYPRLIYPGEYVVITAGESWISHYYVIKDPATISEISGLVSLPDDKGYVGIFDRQGRMIDEVSYSEKWHFALLNNKEGVALERINYSQSANEQSNWTSAASAAGFGTPGYQNSQFRADVQAQGNVIIDPRVFSPDNDGFNDIALIHYEMEEAGYMGSVTIFDVSGRPVRMLLKNGLLGIKGMVSWDGTDEKLQKLPVGIYVVLVEIFNLKGKVKKFKNSVTLARKF